MPDTDESFGDQFTTAGHDQLDPPRNPESKANESWTEALDDFLLDMGEALAMGAERPDGRKQKILDALPEPFTLEQLKTVGKSLGINDTDEHWQEAWDNYGFSSHHIQNARKERGANENDDETNREREYEEWADNPNTWCDRCGNDGCDYCKDKGIGIYYKKNKGNEGETIDGEYREWGYSGVDLSKHMDIDDEDSGHGGSWMASCDHCDWFESADGFVDVDIISSHLRKEHNIYKGSGSPPIPSGTMTEAVCANCNGKGCSECEGTGDVPLGTRLEQLDRSGEHHTGEPHSHGHSDLEEIEGAVEADDGTGNYATCSACHRVMNGTGCVGYLEIDGKRYERLGFGENGEGTEDGCPDCYVKEYGAKHHWGCDNETCPSCQGQALGCDCDSFELIVDGTESKAEEHGWDLPENPTKSQIKKAIKKLQMFIHYAGMENPMHMGEFREELAELEARLASANEDWQKHLPVGMTIRGYECPICFMSIKFEKEFGGTGKNLYNHLLERHGVDDSEAQDMVQTAKSGVKDDYEKVFQDYESPYGEADSKSNQNIKNLKLRNQKRQWGRRGESIDTIKSLGVGGDDIDTNPKYHGKSLEELLKIKEEYFGTIGNLDLGDDPDMSDYDDLNWEIGLLQGEYTGEGVGDFFKKLSGRGDQTWGSDPITHGDFEIMWNNADVQQRIKWLEDVQGSADGLQNESYDKLPQWVQVQLFYHTGDLDQHEDLLETPNISLESYDYYSPKKSKPRTKYSSNKAHKMRKGTGELTKDNLLKHIKSEGTYDPEENNTYNTASSVRNKTDRYLQELESEGWIEQKMQSNKLVWVPTRHGSGRTGNIGEGGNGSGRKFHQQWMNDADKIDSIKSDDMTKDKFLKRAKAIEIEYTDEDQYRRMFEQLKDG